MTATIQTPGPVLTSVLAPPAAEPTTACNWCHQLVPATEDTEWFCEIDGAVHMHPRCTETHDHSCTTCSNHQANYEPDFEPADDPYEYPDHYDEHDWRD